MKKDRGSRASLVLAPEHRPRREVEVAAMRGPGEDLVRHGACKWGGVGRPLDGDTVHRNG